MQLSQGQIIAVQEQGGPNGKWLYQQAIVEILRDFNDREQATAYVQAGLYDPQGQSIECQFVEWLKAREFIRHSEAPASDWNVTTTLLGARGGLSC